MAKMLTVLFVNLDPVLTWQVTRSQVGCYGREERRNKITSHHQNRSPALCQTFPAVWLTSSSTTSSCPSSLRHSLAIPHCSLTSHAASPLCACTLCPFCPHFPFHFWFVNIHLGKCLLQASPDPGCVRCPTRVFLGRAPSLHESQHTMPVGCGLSLLRDVYTP